MTETNTNTVEPFQAVAVPPAAVAIPVSPTTFPAVAVPFEAPRIELPTYKCHHEVRAGKISRIERSEGGYDLFCSINADSDAKVHVLSAWHEKQNPQVGGYVVVYADGLRSFRPADQFEADYKKTDAAHVEPTRTPAADSDSRRGFFENDAGMGVDRHPLNDDSHAKAKHKK